MHADEPVSKLGTPPGTAVTLGHSLTHALGTLAEDTTVLVIVSSVTAHVRSRMRTKAQACSSTARGGAS